MLARYLRLAGHAVHEADKVHLRWSVRARYMCPRPVVVLGVLSQNSREMPLSKHDNVVKAFASDRANQPLGIGGSAMASGAQ